MSGLMRQPRGYGPPFAALGHAMACYPGGLGPLLAGPAVPGLLGVLWLAERCVGTSFVVTY